MEIIKNPGHDFGVETHMKAIGTHAKKHVQDYFNLAMIEE